MRFPIFDIREDIVYIGVIGKLIILAKKWHKVCSLLFLCLLFFTLSIQQSYFKVFLLESLRLSTSMFLWWQGLVVKKHQHYSEQSLLFIICAVDLVKAAPKNESSAAAEISSISHREQPRKTLPLILLI